MNIDNNVVFIPRDEIRTDVLNNIRTVFDNEKIEELAVSIQRDGLLNPVTVIEVEDDEGETVVALVAGERRIRAISYIQEHLDDEFMKDGVPCCVWTGTETDAIFANAMENIEREDVDDVDLSAWIFARQEEGKTQTELAERLNRSLSWVNNRSTFHERACQELKDLLREGLITFSAAYELAKNVDEAEQKKRVKKAKQFNEKISLAEAKTAGDPDKTSSPSKKERAIWLARMEKICDDKGDSDCNLARGAATAFRFMEGLMTSEDMEEFAAMAEDEGPESSED